jgi:ribosome-binding protein aMBF1 (putative translation factor)
MVTHISVGDQSPWLDVSTPRRAVRYEVPVLARRVAEPVSSLKAAFGRAVQGLRTRAGYSPEQLGARAGLPPADVAAIERGDHNVSLATLERLARAFGMRLSELLAEAERQRTL